jgi:protocatechuate 3,4-dioxygenase beta subunit
LKRTPHIHLAVFGPDVETLVIQMYFAGNPLNAQDFILNSIQDVAERERLLVP